MLDSRGNVAGTEAQGTIAPIHTVDVLSGSSTDFFMYAQHGRHLYGESPEWGLASAYH